MPRKSFWARLPFGVRMATAGLGVLALVAGTAGGIAALTSDDARVVTAVGQSGAVVELPAAEVPGQPPSGLTGLGGGSAGRAQAEQDADDTRSAPGEADRTATRSPRRAHPAGRAPAGTAARPAAPAHGARPAAPAAGAGAGPAAPQVRTEMLSETEAIPFRTTLVRDPSLPPGSREIDQPGVPGERLLRYEVTYTCTQETRRRLLDSTVTREPQDRIVAFGPRGRGGQHSGGQHSGGGRGKHDRGRGEPRECRLLGTCVRMGRSAVCTDGDQAGTRPESIIDGDLSLLDPSDIDELELTLPCPDEDSKAGKTEAEPG
jgi:surface rod structure-forming protein G